MAPRPRPRPRPRHLPLHPIPRVFHLFHLLILLLLAITLIVTTIATGTFTLNLPQCINGWGRCKQGPCTSPCSCSSGDTNGERVFSQLLAPVRILLFGSSNKRMHREMRLHESPQHAPRQRASMLSCILTQPSFILCSKGYYTPFFVWLCGHEVPSYQLEQLPSHAKRLLLMNVEALGSTDVRLAPFHHHCHYSHSQ